MGEAVEEESQETVEVRHYDGLDCSVGSRNYSVFLFNTYTEVE